jgi:hypothetical protein
MTRRTRALTVWATTIRAQQIGSTDTDAANVGIAVTPHEGALLMHEDSTSVQRSTSTVPASREQAPRISSDDARAFLSYFPVTHRSTVANWFHYAVRAGASTPLMVIARVRQEIHHRLRWAHSEDTTALLSQVLGMLQSDAAGACAYAESVIGWERLPCAERQRKKTTRAEQYQQQYMATQPPTAKQLAYLATLGYRGALPANRLAASALIDEALSRKGGRR